MKKFIGWLIIGILLTGTICGVTFGVKYYSLDIDTALEEQYDKGYSDALNGSEGNYRVLYQEAVNKLTIAQNNFTELQAKYETLKQNSDSDKEELAKVKENLEKAEENIFNLTNDVKFYQELLEAYESDNKFQVTFSLFDNGKEYIYDVQVIEPNGYLSEVITPERADFEGWSLTKGGELIDDLTTIQVTENMTIYGMCTNTVTFMVNGEEYATQEVSYGKYATDIEVSLAGYTFEGWSLTEGGEIITFNTIPIMKDIIFYACIEKRLYSISEYSEGNQIGILDYYIFNANDLIYLSNSENAFNGINLYLANDIDMSNIQFKTINNFNGNFNGQNHTIYNLNTSLFNYLGSNFENRIEVCNLILKNSNLSYVANSNYYGVLANMLSNVDLYNCHNISSYTASYTGDVSGGIGGLFGSVAHCNIEK